MKNTTLTVFAVSILIAFSTIDACAQKRTAFPEDKLDQTEYAAHLRFLASDELRGRMTGTPWLEVAARYVAEQFRAAGLAQIPGAEGYLQVIPLSRKSPPSTGQVVIAGDTLRQGRGMMIRNGGGLTWSGVVVYVGYGTVDPERNIDDFKGLDLKGKVAVAKIGSAGGSDFFTSLTTLSEKKRQAAAERGAVALIELYRGQPEWRLLVSFLGRAGLDIQSTGSDFVHFLVEDTAGTIAARAELQKEFAGSIQTPGVRMEVVRTSNVLGLVRGSDPKLRDEYVLLTAHYDHIGTRAPRGGASAADTIYNGARDNAMGTVALMAAARSFVAHPPRRSVVIAALTGEEAGGFGSRYLAEHPPVPMNQIVFDLNSDGAGFDDTTIVTVVGLERTTAQDAISKGAKRYGLEAIKDPVPEQNLFNRSDNTKFASLGVPAPTFSAGFRAFGDEINKYYHQAADEAGDDFNFSYFLKFCKAYVHAARLIGDMNVTPFWTPGDTYEQAGRKLYKR
jgi:hypothetical protein